ncbi:MAG: tyrosinase family protein [Actinomycetota bacterium]|nr:tyrosinase family protein [Actinomycetota bacterium]
MATVPELRERTSALVTDLLSRAADRSAEVQAPRRFRWFDPDDAAEAVALAAELAIAEGRAATEEEGLEDALDVAESRTDLPPALVAQSLAMFVTHHRPARRLGRPRTLRAAPDLFAPSRPDTAALDGAPGPEQVLDYWREDPFANEHHLHWHQVYPFAGLVPADWLVWAETADRAGLAALLAALDPARDWPAFLVDATPQQIQDTFFALIGAQPDVGAFLGSLGPTAYRALFRLNDRQGELFFYMHSQMLARYDAERLALGRARVTPFGPAHWGAPIPESYDPGPNLPDFTPREANEKLPQRDIDRLTTAHAALTAAIASGDLLRAGGAPAAVDRDSLGAATEAAAARLTGLDRAAYPGTHNAGHNMLGELPDDQGTGVMISPAVAIRDPVFWRWHKYIDDINTAWQDTQPAYDHSDAPPVVVRDRLTGPVEPWASPDVLLVSTAGLAEGSDPALLLTDAVGGAAFDTQIATGPVAGAEGLAVVDELTTRVVESHLSNGQTVAHLTHDPFALVVRVRNAATRPTAVTVRTFMAPADEADDRTMWMELDKFLVEVPGGGRAVLYRPDTEFSVVKKPAETDPQSVLDGEADPDDPDYCDCGWPYTLLLPRGTGDGTSYRLAVFCTDAARDLVRPSAGCGSMSFCGAVDRYPDTRDMGYPFSRPFADSVPATLLRLPSAAGRTFTIRHAGQ